MGILVAPRRTARAFARGLGDRSLYGEDFEALLEMRVAEARAKYLAPTPRRKLGWSGTLKFLAYMALATVVSNLSFLLLAPLVPVGIVAMNILRRRSAT
jgi:ABC-type phosphate transport system auxiliary subunit